MRWAVSGLAFKSSPDGFYSSHYINVGMADTESEILANTMAWLLNECPIADGWHEHNVIVRAIDDNDLTSINRPPSLKRDDSLRNLINSIEED